MKGKVNEILKGIQNDGKVLVKATIIKSADDDTTMKHVVMKALVLLAHFNKIPKSYLTRVRNGNVKFETARDYASKHALPYQIISNRIDENNVLLTLIKAS